MVLIAMESSLLSVCSTFHLCECEWKRELTVCVGENKDG